MLCGNSQNKTHHLHLNYIYTIQEYIVIDMKEAKG